MADHFLLKTTALREDCLTTEAGSVLQDHAGLRNLLHRHLGNEAADLFAEPFISGDRGESLSIAWHSVYSGDERPLRDLDAASRRIAEDRLHRLIPQIEGLAADPAIAPRIRAALSLSSPDDIRVVSGHPVLINWGLRSQSEAPALAPFMRGTPEAVAAPPRPVVPMMAAPIPPAATAARAPQQAPQVPVAQNTTRAALPLVAWLPLVVLLGLAFATLLWLLWPGNRIFPSRAMPDAATLNAAAEAELAALRDRRDALRSALSGAQCRADGTFLLPGNLTPEGLLVPAEGAAPQEGALLPDAAVPPSPARVALPPEDGSLLAKLEASSVLVLAEEADGLSTGSGFFVGPGLIVTNEHVIGSAQTGSIMVTNAELGRAVPAELLKISPAFEVSGVDFALLRIPSSEIPAFPLAAPSHSIKLHHVVAAGFPGDVMETEQAYQALMQGDGAAIPGLVLVDGTVNTTQPLPEGSSALVHSAPLASGNSGGPLVDYCGRVLGVNTFVRQGPMRTLNFALSSADLVAFLADTPAAQSTDTSDCQPQLAPPAATEHPAAE